MRAHCFHLAFPVHDLEAARRFYTERLGCGVGRESDRWIDFDLCGHQITAHLVDAPTERAPTNAVDGEDIPVRHFGLVLPWDEWHALAARWESDGVVFLVAPQIRFAGEVGEQATLFVRDPSGNAIELKAFRDLGALFAR
ncbi:MAG: VOC family protein [Myxococcales bacterium]|nr:VOC family protein [Myxococcales bacterium]